MNYWYPLKYCNAEEQSNQFVRLSYPEISFGTPVPQTNIYKQYFMLCETD